MKILRYAAALAFLAATPAVAADLPGNWEIAANIGGMDVPLKCTFTLDGEKVGGKCQGPGAPPEGLPVTGQSKDAKATFTYSINVQGMDLTITYNATLDTPTTMKGDISMSGGGPGGGSFTGKKTP